MSSIAQYFNLGLAIVPVHAKSKRAAIEWSNGSYRPYAAIEEVIAACANRNIGIILGERSGNLIDVDLDTEIAERIAYLFLPDTRTFGHGDRPSSHWLYYVDEPTAHAGYNDLGKKGRGNKGKPLIELRGNGCMTVFPGSTHESGEKIEWHNPDTDIANVSSDTLTRSLGQLHAATLFAIHSDEGMRHDAALAIGGWLARAGYPLEDAVRLVKAIARARGSNEERDSIQAVRDSYSALEDGTANVSGKPTLIQMYGAQLVKLAEQSLGITAQPRKRRIQRELVAIEGVTDQGYDCNDTGNAKRFCALYGSDVRYRVKRDHWLVWGEEGWQVDETGALQRLAVQSIQLIRGEAATAERADRREELAGWAITSGNMPRRNALIEAVKSEPGISITEDEIDQKHSLLKLRNVTVDLETGTAFPHRREDMLVKRSPIIYAEHADCSRWLSFLERIIPSVAVRDYLQRAVGYSLTGYTREHLFFLLYGIGANGKSTFLRVLAALLGEYATATQMNTLTTKIKAGGHSDEIAAMSGARVVTVSEAPESVRWNEGIIKQLTSDDTVHASFKGETGFVFTPTHKLWVALNHLPDSGDDTDGFWRRMSDIPFTVQIPEPERDTKLVNYLIDELPGIMRWAIQGAMMYHREGRLTMPEEVKEATQAYRMESDQMGRWLSDCTISSATKADSEPGMLLYNSYTNWCRMNGETAVSNIAWSRKMASKGYEKKNTDRGTVWFGTKLNAMQQDIANAVIDNMTQDTTSKEHTFKPYSE